MASVLLIIHVFLHRDIQASTVEMRKTRHVGRGGSMDFESMRGKASWALVFRTWYDLVDEPARELTRS